MEEGICEFDTICRGGKLEAEIAAKVKTLGEKQAIVVELCSGDRS